MHSNITPVPKESRARSAALALSVLAAAALASCGGGGDSAPAGQDLAAASPQAQADLDALAPPGVQVSPVFHLAPVVLPAPDISGGLADVHTEQVMPEVADLNSSGLPPGQIRARIAAALDQRARGETPTVTPAATQSTTKVVTYTPAQIRAAYQLPAANNLVPASAAAQAALGAGQTIYVVSAYHHPNAISDLAAYSRQFGLPACASVSVSPSAKLPLAAASWTAGCTVSAMYLNTSGAMTSTAPAYDQGWATETSLDLQQAHAIAPLARLVLIEAPSSVLTDLAHAVVLANKMGAGVVSMSFGASEGSWVSSYDSIFQQAGMQYTAATGDAGTAVNWPAVSPYVVGTGGTSLTYTGSTARSEVVWPKSGGGTSQYVRAPAYQGALKSAYRRVSDVSFDSDPYTGQYVAFTPPGGALGWFSAGGTSAAAPAWAGMLAVGNAQRAFAAKQPLASMLNALYLNVFASSITYARDFLDVVKGADGSCATCAATTGFDNPTGLGTPNGGALGATLSAL